MVADRHVFVVGQQRIVGAEQLADVGGVVDAGVEVGVVADGGRQLQPAIGGAMQQLSRSGSIRARSGRRRSICDSACRSAARGARPSANSGLSVSRRPASAAAPRARRRTGRLERGAQIEDLVADRHAAARRSPPGGANTPNGRFWIGNSGAVGRGDPARARRVMGLIDHVTAACCLGRNACASRASSRRSRLQLLEPGAYWSAVAEAVSNMNAIASVDLDGLSSALLACSNACRRARGPHAVVQ